MQLDFRIANQLQIDSFTSIPYSGNSAAVVFEHRDDLWMQNVACENNLAETAFLSPHESDPNSYYLRW